MNWVRKTSYLQKSLLIFLLEICISHQVRASWGKMQKMVTFAPKIKEHVLNNNEYAKVEFMFVTDKDQYVFAAYRAIYFVNKDGNIAQKIDIDEDEPNITPLDKSGRLNLWGQTVNTDGNDLRYTNPLCRRYNIQYAPIDGKYIQDRVSEVYERNADEYRFQYYMCDMYGNILSVYHGALKKQTCFLYKKQNDESWHFEFPNQELIKKIDGMIPVSKIHSYDESHILFNIQNNTWIGGNVDYSYMDQHERQILYAFNSDGQLLDYADISDKLKSIITGSNYNINSNATRDHLRSYVKEDGNIYLGIIIKENDGTFTNEVYKISWIPDNKPPLTPPAHSYAPEHPRAAKNRLPPVMKLEWIPEGPLPESARPPSIMPSLTFHFPEQEVPVEIGYVPKVYMQTPQEQKEREIKSPYFPLYSLWDYQLSKYSHVHPGRTVNYVEIPNRLAEPSAAHTNFAPLIKVDLNSLPVVKVEVERRHYVKWLSLHPGDYALRRWPWIQKVDLHESKSESSPEDPLNNGYYTLGKFTRELPSEIALQGFGKDLNHKHRQERLEPDRPDIILVDSGLEQQPLNPYEGPLFETGDDTKVFVGPTIQSRIWIMPKDLPKDVRATMKAYSRNWRTDQDHYVELSESVPGSRKFMSDDGKVIYEIAHVMDKDDNIVDHPTPEIINDLYIYITDKSIGLDHSAQFVSERGNDTGEYWDWSKPAQGDKQHLPWDVLQEDLKHYEFNVDVTGIKLPPGQALLFSWTEANGEKRVVGDPLVELGPELYRTTLPVLAFLPLGVDGRWEPSPQAKTPDIPGIAAVRYMKDFTIRIGEAPKKYPSDEDHGKPMPIGWSKLIIGVLAFGTVSVLAWMIYLRKIRSR